MCGIVGCVGHHEAVNFAMQGLGDLEYRGYDSMGIAFPNPDSPEFRVVRTLGGVSGIRTELTPDDLLATTAIGHTRWATHGKPAIANTHPHTNSSRSIAVVHNGVIENHAELREELEADGYIFSSQTDTEVIPHLFDYYLREGMEPDQAFTETIKRLVGAYAVLACRAQEPDVVYAAKLGSPLILGVNGSEHFVSSDADVWVGHTKKAIRLEDRELAKITTDEKYRVWSQQGKDTTRQPVEISDESQTAELGDWPHFMLKEIHQQPETVRAAISGRVLPGENLVKLGGLENPEVREKLKNTERIVIVACGTSYHAGLIGERLIEEVAGIPVEVQLASEFQYRNEPLSANTAVLAISQSGETADTRAAVEKANNLGLLSLGINNKAGSTIDQITKAGVHCRAGKEVSVASTKAFTSQVTVLAEIALALRRNSNELQVPLMKELAELPNKIERILEDTSAIEAAAKKYASDEYSGFFFIGRGYEQVSAMEGALKLKEISYITAEAYAAGELKHGPIALIDESRVTFAIATDSPLYEKTLSNIAEIRARGGPVIALASEGNNKIDDTVDDVLYVPVSIEQTQPILNAIVMQLFAYFVAVERGLNVDRPRNLAKSVTVE